jgi:nucleoside 2-deoxyribosyltransferase
MLIYIAGPITGVQDYLRPFNQAENALLMKGHTVLNPARTLLGLSNATAMRVCLSMIDAADAVLMLPGWRDSIGALLENTYCAYIGKPIYHNLEEVTEE